MRDHEQYNERDVHMYRLSDVDVQAEYAWYTQIYLADETAAAVRGMAEMTLIKLGEIVDKPQNVRRRRRSGPRRRASARRAARRPSERRSSGRQG